MCAVQNSRNCFILRDSWMLSLGCCLLSCLCQIDISVAVFFKSTHKEIFVWLCFSFCKTIFQQVRTWRKEIGLINTWWEMVCVYIYLETENRKNQNSAVVFLNVFKICGMWGGRGSSDFLQSNFIKNFPSGAWHCLDPRPWKIYLVLCFNFPFTKWY